MVYFMYQFDRGCPDFWSNIILSESKRVFLEEIIWICRFKLKKVGKTIRPFRYDLNQIPYDYTVEVTNRFKELDLIDKSPWRTMDGGS